MVEEAKKRRVEEEVAMDRRDNMMVSVVMIAPQESVKHCTDEMGVGGSYQQQSFMCFAVTY